jgi:lysophospholipase L1-like esterase
LKRYVAEARQHGATPVLITSMHRRTFDANGRITNSLGDFPEAVRQAAKEEGVPLIDLHAMSEALYNALGPQDSTKLFNHPDGTHHCNYGAYELAKCVVEGIKVNRLAIAKYLMDDVPAFNPAKPDAWAQFKVPASPQGAAQKPDGN